MTSLSLERKNSEEKSGEELLRQDTRGRVRTSRERREALLAEFDRSGVSGAQFARLMGIRYQTFAGWLHVRRRGAAATGAVRGPEPVQWVEAAVAPATEETAPLTMQLPGGAWVELVTPAQMRGAAQLLRELVRVAEEGGRPC